MLVGLPNIDDRLERESISPRLGQIVQRKSRPEGRSLMMRVLKLCETLGILSIVMARE